jgi:hypothetical protein
LYATIILFAVFSTSVKTKIRQNGIHLLGTPIKATSLAGHWNA